MSEEPAIVQIDENFSILYKNRIGQRNDDNQTIIITLTRFRKGLSFNWLNSFQRVNPKECLSAVISTILEFTEHQDATIRVNSYSTLGALLLAVAPFAPLLFIRAFGHATSQMPVSPKSSVAIINMFVYLSRFVSPVRMSEFVAMVPVVHHFGVDVSDYLNHLPQIIPLMKDLPVEFHQNILRSILVSCARKPNYAFANTVFLLVSLNKAKLTQDLLSFCSGNQLENAIIWLGPFLLGDNEIYEIMGQEGRELFLANAIKLFVQEKPQLSLFEYSCKIAAIFLKKTFNTDLYEGVHARIYSVIQPENLKPAFRVKLLNLPTPISEIKLEENDSDSVKGAKLNAVVSYFLDNLELCDADEVSAFFEPYVSSENDLYCTFVECFGNCIKELLARCKNRTHIELLDFILRKKNKNWVHDETVCKMIDKIPLSLCVQHLPNYEELAITKLLDLALSSTDRLLQTAKQSVIQISSYTNLDSILMKIVKSDWITEEVCSRRFGLLAELARLFHSETFSIFVDIAYECLLEFSDTTLLSNIFAFLSNVQIDHMPDHIRTFSFKFIQTQYQMFARRKMEYPGSKYDVPIPAKTFVETLDTDIVTNPGFDHEKVMQPTKNCFAFLYSLPKALLQDTLSLFWQSFYLVPILGKYAIDAAASLIPVTSPYYDHLWNLGLETFKATSKDEVAASCVKLFTNCPKALPPIVETMLENYLQTAGTDPELVFLAFIIVDQKDHELAMERVHTLIVQLDSDTACKLLFKLVQVMGTSLLREIKDEHAPAILQYALDIGEDYAVRVHKFYTDREFYTWPVGDADMDSCAARFLAKYDRVKLSQLEKLDMAHWNFLLKHNDIFDLELVPKFIQENPDFFAKMEVHTYVPQPPHEPFLFRSVPDSVYRIASIQPNLKRNEFVEDTSLIASFCSAGKGKTTPENVLKMLNFAIVSKDTKCIESVLTYSFRNKVQIPDDTISLLYCDDLLKSESLIVTILQTVLKDRPVSEIPAPLKQKILEKIGEDDIKPSLILLAASPTHAVTSNAHKKTTRGIIQMLIRNDPSFFFAFLLEEKFTASKILKLLPLMSQVSFDGDQILILLRNLIPLYAELTRKRKRFVILRLISAVLISLKTQRKTQSFHSLLLQINEELPTLTSDMSPVYLQEISTLIGVMLPFVSQIDGILTTVQWVCKFGGMSLFTFIVHASFIHNTKDTPMTQFLTQQIMEQCLQNTLPSVQANGIRALTNFLATNAPEKSFEFVKTVTVSYSHQYERFAKSFKTAQANVQFMSRLLVNANYEQIPPHFYGGFINNFIGRLNSPQFELSLPLIPRLCTKVTKLYESVWSVLYSNFEIVDTLTECYRVLGQSGRTRDQLFYDYFERAEKFFIQFPSFEMGQLLLKIIADGGENVDAPSYLFSKLPMTTNNFLTLFQVLAMYYRDSKPQMRDSIDVIVEGMSGIIKPLSRGQALRFLVEGNDMATATAIAAAETDDISSVRGLLSE